MSALCFCTISPAASSMLSAARLFPILLSWGIMMYFMRFSSNNSIVQ